MGPLQLHLGVGLDFFPDSSEPVAAVGGEMLRDADFTQEIRLEANHFLRSLVAVEFAKQAGGTLGDGGI